MELRKINGQDAIAQWEYAGMVYPRDILLFVGRKSGVWRVSNMPLPDRYTKKWCRTHWRHHHRR